MAIEQFIIERVVTAGRSGRSNLREEMKTLRMRPRAKQMTWTELFEPERRALRGLLARMFEGLNELEGHQSRQKRASASASDERMDTGFLVFGQRGSGKTTVLLNAAHAMQSPEQFFAGLGDTDPVGVQLREEARVRCGQLIWLERVDMALLPGRTPLLTTLLISIRDALRHTAEERDRRRPGDRLRWNDHGPESGSRGVPASMLEEGSELLNAWERLDELAQDATLMWQGVPESVNPSKDIEPQIRSAETYLRIHERLSAALESATNALARQSGRDPDKVVLVLPIDNADRNADNAYDVLRLIHLVYFPRLWYVLTAIDSDLETFLESAFVKRLRSGERAGADSDEMLSIARRQAAGSQLAALPLAHQVEVEPMSPKEVLTRTAHTGESEFPALVELLRNFNTKFPVRSSVDGQQVSEPVTLLDLMVLVDLDRGKPDERFLSRDVLRHVRAAKRYREGATSMEIRADTRWFTRAGWEALTLPIRRYLDLIQAAQRWQVQALPGSPSSENRPRSVDSERAIELVYEMLRGAIAESSMPLWASDLLTKVFYRNNYGRVCLDLREQPIKLEPVLCPRDVFDLGVEGRADVWCSSRILTQDFGGYVVKLRDQTSGSQKHYQLLSPVSGWMMILYDLLQGAPGPRMACEESQRPDSPKLICTEHELFVGPRATRFKIEWPMPRFETHFECDIMTRMIEALLQALLPHQAEHGDEPYRIRRVASQHRLLRLMMASWCDCMLTAASLGQRQTQGAVAEYVEVSDTAIRYAVANIDEPSVGADVRWRHAFWELFEELQDDPLDVDELALQKYEYLIYAVASHAQYAWTRHADGDVVTPRWADLRERIEDGLMRRAPEYMGCFAPPPDVEGDDQLSTHWQRCFGLLQCKRWQMVRRALEESESKAEMGARHCPDVDSACEAWFRAIATRTQWPNPMSR